MPNSLRRKLLMIAATPVLLGALSAAAPSAPAPATEADVLHYKETFYSSSSYTQAVGYAYGYCDGDYIMVSGYQTSYSKYRFYNQCP